MQHMHACRYTCTHAYLDVRVTYVYGYRDDYRYRYGDMMGATRLPGVSGVDRATGITSRTSRRYPGPGPNRDHPAPFPPI